MSAYGTGVVEIIRDGLDTVGKVRHKRLAGGDSWSVPIACGDFVVFPFDDVTVARCGACWKVKAEA